MPRVLGDGLSPIHDALSPRHRYTFFGVSPIAGPVVTRLTKTMGSYRGLGFAEPMQAPGRNGHT